MVLHQSRLPVPVPIGSAAQCIAIAPIVASPSLAKDFENALLNERPTTQPNLQIVSSDSLLSSSPIRLASTAPLTSDLTAIHAARQAGANVLMIGEVVQDELGDSISAAANPATNGNYNFLGGAGPIANLNPVGALKNIGPESLRRPERLAVAWRVLDVQSGRILGGHTLSIDRMAADRQYPELQLAIPLGRERVLAASARQTWQAVTPYLEREDAVLALPWLQLGASRVRRGNAYARAGQWGTAEEHWSAVAERYPFSNAAHHNLALAYAAREDFTAAKAELGEMNFMRSRKLQSETLLWIDERHRWHTLATGEPPPPEGYAFPQPLRELAQVESKQLPNAQGSNDLGVVTASYEASAATSSAPSLPVVTELHTAKGIDDLPWWTAIPFTKPPGWTWRQWLFQPWAL